MAIPKWGSALSKKQLESYRDSTKRINIWEGAVRSGKSFVCLLRFIKALKSGPEGPAMIVGVSRETIQRNVLSELSGLFGFPMPTPKATTITLFDRVIHLVGANDERAQRKIQGSTIAMAYVDELTLIPESFFKMLLSRLSIPGAQLFATTNPDSPFHWVRKELLDRDDLDLASFTFRIEDNPALDPSYVENLKKEYTGLWYQRYIDGKWVVAQGAVFDFFDPSLHTLLAPPGAATTYVVGVDYGTVNPTAFSLIGYNPKLFPNIWLEREYYYNSKEHFRQKTDTEFAEDLVKFVAGLPVKAIYIDPSAASLQAECRKQGVLNIFDAKNDVMNGIRFMARMIADGTFKILKCCPNMLREMSNYVWDEKSERLGEDKPVKDNDHIIDATRYALFSHFFGIHEEVSKEDILKSYTKIRWGETALPAPFAEPMKEFGRSLF